MPTQNSKRLPFGASFFLSAFSEREELVAEFHRGFAGRTAQFGGEDCNDITGGDRGNMFSVCPGVIIDSYEKCVELLAERGLA